MTLPNTCFSHTRCIIPLFFTTNSRLIFSKFMGYRPDKVEAIRQSQDPLFTAHEPDNEDDIRPDWYQINIDAVWNPRTCESTQQMTLPLDGPICLQKILRTTTTKPSAGRPPARHRKCSAYKCFFSFFVLLLTTR